MRTREQKKLEEMNGHYGKSIEEGLKREKEIRAFRYVIKNHLEILNSMVEREDVEGTTNI